MNEIGTSAVQYYRHSGKAPVLGLLLMGAAGFLGIPILALLYGCLIKYIPFVFLNLLLVAGYAFATGFIVAQAARWGKVRNLILVGGVSLFFGLFAEYAGWIAWMAFFFGKPGVLWEFFHPDEVLGVIPLIAEVGVWSFRGTVPTGGILYFLWTAEAAAVVGGSVFTACFFYMEIPFCEESDAWAEKSSTIGVFAPLSNPREFKNALNETGYAVFKQFQPARSGNQFTIVQLYECADCQNFFVLNLKTLTITFNNKGQRQNKYDAVVSNLLVTPSVVGMIRSLMAQYSVA